MQNRGRKDSFPEEAGPKAAGDKQPAPAATRGQGGGCPAREAKLRAHKKCLKDKIASVVTWLCDLSDGKGHFLSQPCSQEAFASSMGSGGGVRAG